jgi:hypothetical protein
MTMHVCIHGDVFTRTQRIVDWIASQTGWPVITDRDLIETAGKRFNYPTGRMEHCMKAPNGIVNRLTRGTERSVAYLQAVLADALEKEPTIFHGTMGRLSPRELPRVMNVLITAGADFRVRRALHATPGNEGHIRKIIARRDRREFQWCRHVFGSNRFDADAYDLVVPSDRLDRESAGRLILEQLAQCEMRAGADGADRLADFKLAASIQTRLCESGFPVSVDAENGRIQLTVERPVLFLGRLARKMEAQVRREARVQAVETKPGAGFFQADVYRRCHFNVSAAMAFRRFTRCRRRLRSHATEQLPASLAQRVQQEPVRAAQQIESIASP